MQSSSQGYRGYQGYPYVNPIVTDVPSIDHETASRWANLPRRVVKVSGPGPSMVHPGSSGAGSSSQCSQQPQTSRDPVPPKKDIDANPVVYIDLPEAGSEVSQSIESPNSQEPEFVQETIMYNPFDNKRIDMPKEDTNSLSSATGSAYSGENVPPQVARHYQNRPNTLELSTAGSASYSSPSRSTSAMPGYMTKESRLYGGEGSDGFPLSPIPISEFPRPPPAYTEIATTPQTQPQSEPRPELAPPRTQVIGPDTASPASPIGLNYERKNLICHHCGVRVHTLVVSEVGLLTHIIGCIIFILCMPLVILVYILDIFKYKNHYCPNCNKRIGYVIPLVGQKVNLVT